MVGQGDAGAVPPDRQVLMEAEGQSSQSNLNRLSPGEGTCPPGVIFHQNLQQVDHAYRLSVMFYLFSMASVKIQNKTAIVPYFGLC